MRRNVLAHWAQHPETCDEAWIVCEWGDSMSEEPSKILISRRVIDGQNVVILADWYYEQLVDIVKQFNKENENENPVKRDTV